MNSRLLRLADRDREIAKISSPLMGEEETMFLASLSLRQFFDYILIRTSELIVENRKVFPETEKEKIDFIEQAFSSFTGRSIFEKIDDNVFKEVSLKISYLHDKYIWNYFVTDKGRKVYSLKDSFIFMRESHYLFSLIRGKVLDDDLCDVFDLGRSEKVFMRREKAIKFERRTLVKQNRHLRINPES